ncbi:hypothetical protein, conserved [Leishmania tarentolae]|uniref:C3H1-type domain-containing protein n=1 Tax=Leishmania tarentolae TaxID=5689 RepID=A0A640KUV8_LEITA|nr:hypothetical protein, conserved [Leishmania tarentolae]GET93041.1 hypothetical protein, conserved [Leishmania tarentolae]GET93042.1 hypothetical protein, conserved [Leishmania tarentolae]
MSQQQWTPDQRRQQIAEMLRNKGVICRDFLFTGRCSRSPMCPYMHVANGETRPVPWSVCTFFTQGKCLRDGCSFFHGTQAQLEELHASGASVYRLQDYMKVAVPPAEYLNPDGSIATHLSVAALPVTPALHAVHRPIVSHENALNSFQSVFVMQPNSHAIAPTMFASHGRAPHPTPSHFAFYANTPIAPQMPTHSTATVLQPTLQTLQPTTFYQPGNAQLAQPQQHFAPVPPLNTPQQHHSTQHALGSPVYFHIQPH